MSSNYLALKSPGAAAHARWPELPGCTLYRVSEPAADYGAERPKLYLDTTIPSYLTARLSRDLIVARHQQITREWWESNRERFDIYISWHVRNEAARGNTEAARRRLKLLDGLPEIEVNDDMEILAELLLKDAGIPERAKEDATHVAVAAVHRMDFLVTWNCKHLANPVLTFRMMRVCARRGWVLPIICTPAQLLRDEIYEKTTLGRSDRGGSASDT